ncbi:hypothetical protein AWN76_017725 [Rhodothermaceae bacterium RA]|nr:hypothetical protein AWN76_017725 [Rhodothermaceae bacterium RA]
MASLLPHRRSTHIPGDLTCVEATMHPEHKTLILEGEEHFLARNYAKALTCFEQVLASDPANVQALNDAGLALAELDRLSEAVQHFEAALQADPACERAYYNLVDLLIRHGHLDLAVETYVRFYDGIPDTERKQRYERDLRAALQQEVRHAAGQEGGVDFGPPVASSHPLKVAFVCGPDTAFITDLEQQIARRHHVRALHVPQKADLGPIQDVMDWADVVWFEWCDALLIEASRKLTKTSAVVCRLHSYEALSDAPGYVQWDFVDTLVLVAPHMHRILTQRFPGIERRTHVTVIPNGVDLVRYPFKQRAPGFDLAYVGYINHKKNPALLLQCMHALVQQDARYRLHVAGVHQEPRYEVYWNHMVKALGLEQHVIMHGWVDDVAAFLEDKHYLVSTSVHESFGYGIAEAMARGIKPVIHHFMGADELYPEATLFRTVAEFVRLIQEPAYDSAAYRRHVETHYALTDQVDRVDALLAAVVSSSRPAPSGDGAAGAEVVAPGGATWPVPDRPDRPDRTLIVTGIPRSGTSLLSALINEMPNAVCLNEILYDVDRLPEQIAQIRQRLMQGEPVPNKYDESGALTTNTLESQVVLEQRVEAVGQDVVVGSKVNVPYLARLPLLLQYGYRVVGLVRDPVFTIASWSSEKARIIREARVTDDDLDPAWQGFPFQSADRLSRMAEVWQYLASILWQHRGRIMVLRYEDLIEAPEATLEKVAQLFGLPVPAIEYPLSSMNRDDRYQHLEAIREAVHRYAPIRTAFGYE